MDKDKASKLKKAIATVAALSVIERPITARACSGGCSASCEDTCSSCKNSCSHICRWNCENGCNAACKKDCTGCTGSCQGCTGGCEGCSGCGSGCASSCSSTCGSDGCTTSCSSGCNGCTGSCKADCSGCTSTCGANGCSTSCGTGCNGCTGSCKADCSGCSGSCLYGCSGGCSGCGYGCAYSCSGTAAGVYTVTLSAGDGASSTGTTRLTPSIGGGMGTITPPTKAGHTFDGYFTEENGGGEQFFDGNGRNTQAWKDTNGLGSYQSTSTAVDTLYAKWNKKDYNLNLSMNGGKFEDGGGIRRGSDIENPTRKGFRINNISMDYDVTSPDIDISDPVKKGYSFNGWDITVDDPGDKVGSAIPKTRRNASGRIRW